MWKKEQGGFGEKSERKLIDLQANYMALDMVLQALPGVVSEHSIKNKYGHSQAQPNKNTKQIEKVLATSD